jgi:hypothetical protein
MADKALWKFVVAHGSKPGTVVLVSLAEDGPGYCTCNLDALLLENNSGGLQAVEFPLTEGTHHSALLLTVGKVSIEEQRKEFILAPHSGSFDMVDDNGEVCETRVICRKEDNSWKLIIEYEDN